MELQNDGPILLEFEFQQFYGETVRPHYFRVCHCLHHCDNLLHGLDPARVLATGCCSSLVGMSRSSMSNLTFSIERKDRTHLSQVGPSSGNILASSSRRHCNSTFFLYSSCIGLMFWTSPCWSPMRKCFSNSMTAFKETNTAALRTLSRNMPS